MPHGGLARLPDVMSREMMINNAMTQARKIKAESEVAELKRINTVKNDRLKYRGKMPRKKFLALATRLSTTKMRTAYLQKADKMIECITKQFDRWEGKFPTIASLHPFERELVELSLEGGTKTYEYTIEQYFLVKKKTQDFRERARISLSKITHTRGVGAWYNEQIKLLKTFMDTKGVWIDKLKEMFKTLFKANVLSPLLPTAALIGLPNIGKSSLVRAVSSGTPEVQNYAFTTREIIVGHLVLKVNKLLIRNRLIFYVF